MRFIHDTEFIRNNDTPMTKEAVRNQIVSRFNVNENSVIFDIGSGTGSVSLMLARLVPNGKVYAFDTNKMSMEVLEENKRKFSTDHVIGILGTVPHSIEENNLPSPDAVFIGGSNGDLKNIIALFEGKNVPLVLTAITTETFSEVMRLIEVGIIKSGEISQLFLTDSVKLGRYHIMKPQNPVWIISGIL
ncbi:Cobalt-precorrin-6B C(15)-methyltransferase (decarboxylating) [bioreactor metagenome]|uniref:Cobalt-precorrin-6B C(15)-methyltransferase (Decarboxylating) n=1 Tax=bioreactor metagenome TaxID=1076179 RepID=A0A645DNZ7_9ZZZZ